MALLCTLALISCSSGEPVPVECQETTVRSDAEQLFNEGSRGVLFTAAEIAEMGGGEADIGAAEAAWETLTEHDLEVQLCGRALMGLDGP